MKEYNEQVVETLDDAVCIIANKNIIIDNIKARIAELEAENARLKAECDDIKQVQFPRKLEAVAVGWKKQLAAAQAEIKRLRDALQTYIDEHEECQDADDWMAMMCSMEAHHVADQAITQPSDTSALDAYVAEKVNEYQKHNGILGREVKDLTRQRDLAVEALESCVRDDDGCIALAIRTLDTIKESEVK